jgi:hypothetical protein
MILSSMLNCEGAGFLLDWASRRQSMSRISSIAISPSITRLIASTLSKGRTMLANAVSEVPRSLVDGDTVNGRTKCY